VVDNDHRLFSSNPIGV